MKILAMSLLIGLLAAGPVVEALSQPAHAMPSLQPVAYQGPYSSIPNGSHNSSMRDQKLQERVSSTLRKSLGPDASQIGVNVENGNVYLSGTVGSELEMERAWRAASSVRGVNRVFANNVQVVATEERSAGGYPHGYYPFMPRR